MQSNIIEKLFSSFEELEQAIESAKVTLAKREVVPAEIMQRLNSYDGILIKQRNLAKALCGFMDRGEWDEVSRHVTLINGLSAMIRDDARAILSQLALNTDNASDEDRDMNFC